MNKFFISDLKKRLKEKWVTKNIMSRALISFLPTNRKKIEYMNQNTN